MKIMIAVLMLTVYSLSFAQEKEKAPTVATTASPTAGFDWSSTTYDFGKTRVGIPVSYEFRFSNTGMAPLIISSVKASCGCTVTAYTREPVQKGATGFVRATYDAAQAGVYSKTISVYANTPQGVITLTIKGEIVQ